ncbi:MAG: glucan 1,4-alpha-glucosidase [Candidatus Manganitrophaceae bacterium]|nr:MAG: glucan 1,4-alpha-glucosidase [Candidatus Manganitrophaceae bacterium]
MEENDSPPGRPGIPPRWTSSSKTGVGTALQHASLVWFTLSHGIINEVYYPRVDLACIRDFGLIVTGGSAFFSEEKRHTRSQVVSVADGVPAYRLINTCLQGRYRIEKEIVADPRRDALLQRVRFVPLQGALADYRLYALLAPHLGNRGSGNTAWVGDYKGVPMLFAARGGNGLALACSAPWGARSVGFVGFSDGWQDLTRHKEMAWRYRRAESGNVALTGEVDLKSAGGEFVLALGFGGDAAEAGHRALAGLLDGFEAARNRYVQTWGGWQRALLPMEKRGEGDLYRISAAVLRVHEGKHFPGGLIASLSIPWGFAKGDDDLGGYHLVWPRDLVEAAGALLAAGAQEDVVRTLHYLQVTQEADGHWPQNMWLEGSPFWSGVQMDESAFPLLLVDLARREGALKVDELTHLWPMVRRAAGFIVRNGPVTQQDRWEEDPGYSPFTLAVEIAGLLAAADLADLNGEPKIAAYLRETADAWNADIERWTYVADTDLALQIGVEGYYVRITAPEEAEAASPLHGFVPIKNRPPGQSLGYADQVVSPDALALVRFGLRAPDDPRILNTLMAIDALLKVETPFGPAWRRYNGDGYGEHKEGAPFDGTGVGRVWPLLTGERAHYALAAGRGEEAEHLLRAMEGFANEGGMIPEQIWDGPDLPLRELFFGRPSGSAMPLVWAHAEYIKLRRSLRDGHVFDTPTQTVQRYLVGRTGSPYAVWRFNHKRRTVPAGKTLRIEVLAPALIRWSADGWKRVHDTRTEETGLGIYRADLPIQTLSSGEVIHLTFYWPEVGRWENFNFAVAIE